MRALAFVVLAGCAAEAAPAPPKLNLLVEVPAWSVEAIAGKLVVVDDGLLSVTALDAATGAKAWTQKLQKEPARGAHGLVVNGASLIAWFADKAHVLDGATGKRGASYDTVLHGGGCWLDIKEGACARRCPCSFQIADCATGALRGKSYEGVYMEEIDPDGGMSSGCWGHGGWLHGKAGNLALLGSEDAAAGKTKALAKTVAAAVDLTTGKEVWRRELYASIQSYESGHSPDGKTCWFTGIMGDLQVLDCATGKALWSTKAPPRNGPNPHLVAFVPGKGIYEMTSNTATLHAERTGKRVWSLAVPPGSTAWIAGTEPPIASYTEIPRIVLLEGATGKPLGSIAVAKGSYVHMDRAGTFLIESPAELVAYDAMGKVTARAAVAMPNLDVSPSFVTARRENDILVLDRTTLKELAKLPGTHGSVHLEGELGPRRLVAWFYDAKQVGKAQLYALTP